MDEEYLKPTQNADEFLPARRVRPSILGIGNVRVTMGIVSRRSKKKLLLRSPPAVYVVV